MTELHVSYSDELLKWQLGNGHPTNPERAKNAISILESEGVNFTLHAPELVDESLLSLVHSEEYLNELRAGKCSEWQGVRPDLYDVARRMCGSTMQLLDIMPETSYWVGFAPQGAKHHAQYDRASGFCVLNDMAIAAHRLAAQGKRVAYLDWDIHHGDGVENLTRDDSRILTASIHEGGIFPGTGNEHQPENLVYNWALDSESEGIDLRRSVQAALVEASFHEPDVLLLAIGADGHVTDPLSTALWELKDYEYAAGAVKFFAQQLGIPVLVGGAGGYQPHTWTPLIWATVIETLVA